MKTRRQFMKGATAGAALLLQGAPAFAVPSAPDGKQRLLIGTSSISEFYGHGQGIYMAEFQDGQLTTPTMLAKAPDPSFLAVPESGAPLFAVEQPLTGSSKAVAYSLPPDFKTVSRAGEGGGGGCHISVSKDGRCVFVANYGNGSVESFLADEHGNLKHVSLVKFSSEEHGPDQERQLGSHAHCANISPDGDFLLVNDLGTDRIHILRLNRRTAELTPNQPEHWSAAPGSGPRHLLCHPNGKWIYSINELSSTIDQLQWNATHGVLTKLSTVVTLPPTASPINSRACEMVFSKDTRFLYAANRRVHESVAVFAVDPQTGALKMMQERRTLGVEPRHLAVDPSGKWLLVAHQFSGDVSVFPLDTEAGTVGARTMFVPIPGASCVLFA